MKVRDIISDKGKDIITINADANIVSASAKMADRNVGALLVEEGERLVGLITERDIVNVLARTAGRLEDVRVKNIMIKGENLLITKPEDEAEYALTVMIQNSIRHLPVVEKGEITGIISIRDAAKINVKELKAEIHFLKDYIADRYV